MSIKFFDDGDLHGTVAKLRALASDLENMGMFKPRLELERAPVLTDYRFCVRKVPSLFGTVEGHPILGTRQVVTSEIFAIDQTAGWARTFSRFYRLEDPINDHWSNEDER
jgi:hypothetical protein